MLDIMAGMDQKDSFLRGFWWRFLLLPEECVSGLFWEMTSGTISVSPRFDSGSFLASFYGCFWKNFIFST